jgi:16S rRNA processing protein RimM
VLGDVVRPSGLQGSVVVRTDLSARAAFRAGLQVTLLAGTAVRADTTITDVRPHRAGVLLALEAIGDREGAQAVVGCKVVADRSDLPSPAATEFYAHDLIGASVVGLEGEPLGTLVEILATGANDVWIVSGDLGEWLIPAVAHAVVAVDSAANRITVDPSAATRSEPRGHGG